MRTRGILMAAVVAGMGLATPLEAAPRRGQTVEGSIRLSMANPVDPAGCLGGVQYQFAWLNESAFNGVVGFQFKIDERTWGKKYELVPLDGTKVDLDIFFFPQFQPLYTTGYEPHASRRPGGEQGIVPGDMHDALVCLHTGSDVAFRYTAGG